MGVEIILARRLLELLRRIANSQLTAPRAPQAQCSIAEQAYLRGVSSLTEASLRAQASERHSSWSATYDRHSWPTSLVIQ